MRVSPSVTPGRAKGDSLRRKPARAASGRDGNRERSTAGYVPPTTPSLRVHPRLAGPESSSRSISRAPSSGAQPKSRHPHGMMDVKWVLGRRRGRVPWRQNLPSFTSGQENTQQVEKPWLEAPSSRRLFSPVLAKKPEYFTQAPEKKKYTETTPCAPTPGRAEEPPHVMVTAPQAPLPHGTCSGVETRENENKKVLINCAAKTPRAAREGEKEVKVGRRDPFFLRRMI